MDMLLAEKGHYLGTVHHRQHLGTAYHMDIQVILQILHWAIVPVGSGAPNYLLPLGLSAQSAKYSDIPSRESLNQWTFQSHEGTQWYNLISNKSVSSAINTSSYPFSDLVSTGIYKPYTCTKLT